jgi:LmbE family N-acetylglucosaminyl deacetylase
MYRLACVFAHPDDETFSVGGMLAKLAEAGTRSALFCATDGDAGRSSGIPVASRAELGAIRRAELAAAARILGIASLSTPGHGDGLLRDVDPERLIGGIVLFLRTHRPQVVVTFGPEGAPNGHRDHRAISRAATAAFFLSGLATEFPEHLREVSPHRAARLYYCAWDPETEPRLLSVPLTARVDVASFRDRKRDAFLAHASQREHQARFETVALKDSECFALAAGEPQPRAVVEDLFEGL